MKRSTFLPVFFTVLALVFGIVAWIRVRTLKVEIAPSDSMAVRATGTFAEPAVAPGQTSFSNPETGTLVNLEAGGGEEVAASTRTLTTQKTREQRYQELLRAQTPQPPPAPAAPVPPPTMLERVVAPIASALGMQPRMTGGPAAVPQQPRPQPPVETPAPEEEPPPPDRGPYPPPSDDGAEKDPETDVTPPQLHGAEFSPPEVQDGGETVLTAFVSDNLSGVRSVSGVVASPSGALQGFACQREGQTDRFVTRIRVPREAAEGTWAVKYLTLTDQANNSINLNQAGGGLPPSASFRVVSNAPDSTAPVLRSVYLERRSMSAGERNMVFVQADDEKSGVSLVSGVFVSPSKQARIGFGCRPGQGGPWECTVAPPSCLDCGTWQLEQIQVQDKANNMATFRADNQLISQVALDIAGESCDAGPPAIRSIQLNPLVVSNSEGGIVQIAALVSDDACGVASLSGQAVPANSSGGQRIYFSFDPSPDGSNFLGRIAVPKHAAKGTWTIGWIQALDKGHNLKAYSSNDPVLARATFTVE